MKYILYTRHCSYIYSHCSFIGILFFFFYYFFFGKHKIDDSGDNQISVDHKSLVELIACVWGHLPPSNVTRSSSAPDLRKIVTIAKNQSNPNRRNSSVFVLCEQGEGEGNGNGPHAVLSSKVVAEDGAQVDGNGDGDGGGDGGGGGGGGSGGSGGGGVNSGGGSGGSGSTWIPGPDAFEAGVNKAKKSLVLHVIPGKYWIYHIYI